MTHRWLLHHCPRLASQRGHCTGTTNQQATLTLLNTLAETFRDIYLKATLVPLGTMTGLCASVVASPSGACSDAHAEVGPARGSVFQEYP